MSAVEDAAEVCAGWRPFDWFILRATGFPLSRLLELAGDAPPDAAGWGAALASTLAKMAGELGEEDTAEALFVSNPELADRLPSWTQSLRSGRRNAADRARERTILTYLGRFTAKNETTSFFGASSLGRFDREPASGPEPTAAVRAVFLEQWVGQRLLSLAAAELRASGDWVERPRRAPMTGRSGEAAVEYVLGPADAWFSVGAGVPGRATDQLLGGADGTRTRAELGARCDGTRAEVDDAFDALLERGLLQCSEHLAGGVQDVLGSAIDVLLAQPESAGRARWLGRFAALRGHLERFAAARGLTARRAVFEALEGDLRAWLGESPRRHAGQHYASRTAIHEKADRTGRVVGPPGGFWEAIQGPLGLCLELPLALAAADRLTFRAWFERRYGLEVELGWGDVCRALDAEGPRFHLAAPPRARELRQALRGLQTELGAGVRAHIARHGAGAPFALPEAQIREALSGLSGLLGADEIAYANPDLMPRLGPDGALTGVLGEAHDQITLTPSLYPAAPERERAAADTAAFVAALAAPERPALVVRRRAAFMAWAPDLGAVALELDADSGQPPERRAPLAELAVRLTAEGFRFRVSTHAGERVDVLPLTFGSRTALATRVFGVLPLDFGTWLGGSAPDALPRLTLGALALHRRRFRVPSAAWADAADPAESAELLRRSAPELPRVVFVRLADEPKPLVVDLHNPVALELLRHRARQAASLTLVEMLPEPDHLWLRGPGGLHTAELRTVLIRGGSGFADADGGGWRGGMGS